MLFQIRRMAEQALKLAVVQKQFWLKSYTRDSFLNIAEEEKRSEDKFQILTFRQKVIGDCCDGLTGSPYIYIVTQGGIQSRKKDTP